MKGAGGDHPEFDLAVIGTGMAGLSAALFASNRGLSVVLAGRTGGLTYASGLFDLAEIHPIRDGRSWSDPWDAIDTLRADIRDHPLARVPNRDIRTAIEEILSFLKGAGLPYHVEKGKNSETITPLGTIKRTYAVPLTMTGGVRALVERPSGLLVDFQGLKEYSAAMVAAGLRSRWPGLRTASVAFPGMERMSRVYARPMAQALELEVHLETLAERLRPIVGDAQVVGLPAVLGLNGRREITVRLGEMIGASVFEVPMLSVSVPGMRLKETFERELAARGVTHFFQKKVLAVHGGSGGPFTLSIGDEEKSQTVHAKGVVLATGRFFGKGLAADRKRIRETVFDLPVIQPRDRTRWHREDLMDPKGHPVSLAGLQTDDAFRPLDRSGRPAFRTLFAAGSILAHQDWIRTKCGTGLAAATAYAAVEAFQGETGREEGP